MNRTSTRRIGLWTAVAGLGAPAAVLGAAHSASANQYGPNCLSNPQQAGVTCVWTDSTMTHQFVIPANVTSIGVDRHRRVGRLEPNRHRRRPRRRRFHLLRHRGCQ